MYMVTWTEHDRDLPKLYDDRTAAHAKATQLMHADAMWHVNRVW